MPGFDRTGPEGQGPKTGRGLGKCNPGNDKETNGSGADKEKFPARLRMGRGRRQGRPMGRGRGLRGWRSE